MAWYRISKIKILGMTQEQIDDASKMVPILDEIAASVSAISADFIEIATTEDDTLIVIARYPDEASMEAATETAKNAFKRFFEQGASNPSSLEIWTGEVTHTF